MAAHDSNQKGPLIPVGLTPEEKAHHLENLSVDLRLSPEELDEYRRARFETTEWFNRSINQFTRLGNTEKVEELVKRKEAFEARPQPLIAENLNIHSDDHGSHGALHSSPQYLDRDERYKRIVEERVATWNKEHPNEPLPTDVLTEREDGSRVIHEDIIKAIPAIEEEADKSFAAKYNDDYTRFKENEKSRIYKDSSGNPLPENDPAYKKMMHETKERIEKARLEYEKIQQEKLTVASPTEELNSDSSFEATEKKIWSEEYKEFIKNYKLKAEEYAKEDSELNQALSEYEEEKELEEKKKEFAQKVARNLRKMENQYDQLSAEELEEITPERIEQVSINEPSIGSEGGVGESAETLQGLGGSEAGGFGSGLRSQISPGNIMRNGARIGRAGINNAGQLASRAGTLAAKAAPLVTNPWFWVAMGALVIIILIILVLAGVLSSGSQTQENIPVTITKSGPTEVANGENITYTINVSYPGSATDIIITDPIPQGAEFVEASGVFSCEPEPCGALSRTITWKASEQRGGPISGTPAPSPTSSATGFSYAVYQAEGFPPPQEPNPVTLDSAALQIYKSSVVNHITKASQVVGIDPGITAMWSFFEGINYNNSFSNCNDTGDRFDPNVPCMTNNWQVGHGIRPGETYGYLQAAFDTMYGGHDDATIQRVGQSVIQTVATRHPENAITYPGTTFPNVSLSQLTNNMGDPEMRTWVGHLMRDDAIYAYLISRVFKGHWDAAGSLAFTMECCWGSATHYASQRVINYVKAVYEVGLTGGGTSFPAMIFDLTVKPIDDSYIINQASAQVIP